MRLVLGKLRAGELIGKTNSGGYCGRSGPEGDERGIVFY